MHVLSRKRVKVGDFEASLVIMDPRWVGRQFASSGAPDMRAVERFPKTGYTVRWLGLHLGDTAGAEQVG